MKVLVAGCPRTRSSILIDSVCQRYSLQDKFEDYIKYQNSMLLGPLPYKGRDFLWEKYQTNLGVYTNQLFNSGGNYAIKFFPNILINYTYRTKKDIHDVEGLNNFMEDYHKKIMLDLSVFRLAEYDEIYFLTRNTVTNAVCSWMSGYKNKGTFLFTDESTVKKFQKIDYLDLSSIEMLSAIDVLLITYALQSKLEKYIDNLSVKCIKMEYSEVANYISRNFGVTPTYIEPKFDYTEIQNYNEINEYVTNRFALINEKFSSLEFR